MEVKSIVITVHAIQTLHEEFEYLKQNTSVTFAYKFRTSFIEFVDNLPGNYLLFPECRFLRTKNKIYRNIIWKDYLIVYKILKKEILVLGVFHGKQNPIKLKSYRRIR